MIQKLDWDSALFGYPVGKMELAKPKLFDSDEFKKTSLDFKLVYLFSKNPLLNLPEDFLFVDKKTFLTRKTEKTENEYSFSYVYPFEDLNADILLNLTMISGVYSRFNLDKNFTNNEYSKLYTTWINESVKRKVAKDIFIYKDGNDILGFITLAEKNKHSNIGLIAVAEEARGKGIGTVLIKYAIHNSFLAGYSDINVVTQMNNVQSIQLYKQNGFRIADISYVYHYWNK